MDFIDGRVIESSKTAQSLSAQQASEISQELVDTLARLHAVDPAAAGLDQLGKPAGYLQRQVKRWGEQWQITKTRELPEIEALHAWLETAIGGEVLSILKRIESIENEDDGERLAYLRKRVDTAKGLARIIGNATERAVEDYEEWVIAGFVKELEDL
jgi:aminoglycoside phosphotransferase (APT) family kinase protein